MVWQQPETVEGLTREELIAKERRFNASDPIGIIFGFGSTVGFVVGIVIVYQVLYTDISDHLPEYATLKAMGYSDGALLRVVLMEVMLLAVLGFIPGFTASVGLYQVLTAMTHIPLAMKIFCALPINFNTRECKPLTKAVLTGADRQSAISISAIALAVPRSRLKQRRRFYRRLQCV